MPNTATEPAIQVNRNGTSIDLRDDPRRRHVNDDEAGRGRGADEPHDIPPTGWRDIAVRVKQEFAEDHVTLAAGGVAFFGFLALIPLLFAGVSIYGLIADPSHAVKLVNDVRSSVPNEVADLLEQQLQSVTGSSGGALGLAVVLGILTSLWTASSGAAHLIEAINIAYGEDLDSRPWWKKRLLALSLALGALVLVALIGATVSLTAALGTGAVGVLIEVVGWVVVAALMAGALSVLYRYGPDRDEAEWSWVSYGAAATIVMWVAVSIGFRFYVSNFGSYNETYGSLGAVVVLLMWLYLSALLVILGAEINAETEHQTATDTTDGPDEPRGRRGAFVADTVGSAEPMSTEQERHVSITDQGGNAPSCCP